MCAGRVGWLPWVYRRGTTREREFAVERFLQRSKSLQVCAWAFSIIAGLAGLAPAGHAQVSIPATAATEVRAGNRAQTLYGGKNARSDLGDPQGDGAEWTVTGIPAGSRESALDTGIVKAEKFVIAGDRLLITAFALAGPDEPTFGWSVSCSGDLDADGGKEIIVGAPGANLGAGKVYVYSGRARTLLFTIDSPVAAGRFGEAVCCRADFDGDGVPDIMVGAPKAPDGGAVYVYSGRTRALIRTYTAPIGGRNFGRFLASFQVPEAGAAGAVIGGEISTQTNVWEVKSYHYWPLVHPQALAGPPDPICPDLPNVCEREFCEQVTSAQQAYAATMADIARERSTLFASRSDKRLEADAAYNDAVERAKAPVSRNNPGWLQLLLADSPFDIFVEVTSNTVTYAAALNAAAAQRNAAYASANQELLGENARLDSAEESALATLNAAINDAIRRKCGCKRRLNIQPEPGECDEPPLNP